MTTPSPKSQTPSAQMHLEQPLQMSYDEYLAWANEDVHAEWVNGEVIVHMPPNPQHQRVVAFLMQLLGLFVRLFQLGELLPAPLEMRATPDGPAREPDLLFVAREHLERLTEARLSGPADLVVEVVSDDSVARDRADKFYEYQAAGIKEYWIIDPRPGCQRVDFYVLDNEGRYRPIPVDPDGRYHSTLLPGLWLQVVWVLAAEPPDVLRALAQIVGPQKLLEAVPEPTAAAPWRPALALEAQDFRHLGHELIEMIADYLEQLPERPVFRPMSESKRRMVLEQPLPQESGTPADIVHFLATHVLPFPMGNGHPRFFGWVNSPPAPLAVLTELLATAMNPSCAGGDHAAIYLERCTVRWLMELIGYPTTGSFGLLVSGGSVASLTALAVARHWAAQNDGWDIRAAGLQGQQTPLTLYISEEGHSCCHKAVELLGIGRDQLRIIPVNAHFQIDVAALQQAVQADHRAGRRPFCVIASAGTVNTGAIDPLQTLADFCTEAGLWLHVDGAYGAFGCLDAAKAEQFAGLPRADSVALDPHKWLSVPVECGCVLVRQGTLLREAFSLVPPYLRTEEGRGFGGLPWYAEYGVQQTRGFRAMKLWTVLRQAGRAGLVDMVTRHIALAERLVAAIDTAPDLELMAPAPLSIVCWRYVPLHRTLSPSTLDALNKELAEVLQQRGEVFLTHTTLKGRLCLRANVLHFATTEADIDFLVHTVRTTGAELANRPETLR